MDHSMPRLEDQDIIRTMLVDRLKCCLCTEKAGMYFELAARDICLWECYPYYNIERNPKKSITSKSMQSAGTYQEHAFHDREMEFAESFGSAASTEVKQ
jgi:hypothetical protein